MPRLLKFLWVVPVLLIVASCGSGEGSDVQISGSNSGEQSVSECGESSLEEPAEGSDVFSCGMWEFSVGPLNEISSGVLEADSAAYQEPLPGEKYVGIKITATLIGDGPADLGDVFQPFGPGGLVGALNKRYEAQAICCDSSKGIVGEQWAKAPEPFKGGTVSGWVFFLVDSQDSDFVLGLDLDSNNDVKIWVRPMISGPGANGAASEYENIDDLVSAFVEAGGSCANPRPSDESTSKAIAQVICGETSSLFLFSSEEDIETYFREVKGLIEALDQSQRAYAASLLPPFLIGPNWVAGSFDAFTVQETLGGRIVSFD